MKKIKDDIFLVGVDIEHGEYMIESNWDGGMMVTVSKDEFMSDIVFDIIEDNGCYVVDVRENEYLELDGCTAVPLSVNSKPDRSSGYFSDKIGHTLNAGEYAVSPLDKDDYAEYIIYDSARYKNSHEVKAMSIDNSVIVKFRSGQYVFFRNCKLKKIER